MWNIKFKECSFDTRWLYWLYYLNYTLPSWARTLPFIAWCLEQVSKEEEWTSFLEQKLRGVPWSVDPWMFHSNLYSYPSWGISYFLWCSLHYGNYSTWRQFLHTFPVMWTNVRTMNVKLLRVANFLTPAKEYLKYVAMGNQACSVDLGFLIVFVSCLYLAVKKKQHQW